MSPKKHVGIYALFLTAGLGVCGLDKCQDDAPSVTIVPPAPKASPVQTDNRIRVDANAFMNGAIRQATVTTVNGQNFNCTVEIVENADAGISAAHCVNNIKIAAGRPALTVSALNGDTIDAVRIARPGCYKQSSTDYEDIKSQPCDFLFIKFARSVVPQSAVLHLQPYDIRNIKARTSVLPVSSAGYSADIDGLSSAPGCTATIDPIQNGMPGVMRTTCMGASGVSGGALFDHAGVRGIVATIKTRIPTTAEGKTFYRAEIYGAPVTEEMARLYKQFNDGTGPFANNDPIIVFPYSYSSVLASTVPKTAPAPTPRSTPRQALP